MEKKKRKVRSKKKIESITGQIHDIILQIPELKSKALEKQATSAYDKAEDQESDIHALDCQLKEIPYDRQLGRKRSSCKNLRKLRKNKKGKK